MTRIRRILSLILLSTPLSALGQESGGAFGRINNLDNDIDFLAYHAAGWRALGKGYLDTAEHEFRSAIKAAGRMSPVDDRLQARAYSDYAWALQLQRRYAEAEPLAKWALTVREARFAPDSTAVVQSLNQLATLYFESGRPLEAEPLLLRAIAAQEKSSRPNLSELARSRALLGLVMVDQGRFPEAEVPFAKAVAALEKTRGNSAPETGDALANLARTYYEQRKFDQARPLFERAQAIFERTRGPADPSVSRVLDPLARIDEALGDDEAAEAKYRRALGIWDKLAPGQRSSRADVARHFADLLDRRGRPEEARKYRPNPPDPGAHG